jgi:hypothetical protein
MDTTFDGAASALPILEEQHTPEPGNDAPPDNSIPEKPQRAIRKQIPVGDLDLHPDFAEFKTEIARITFELKSVWQAPDTHLIKEIARREIKAIEKDGKYLIVAGIRSWQVATTLLAPKTRIEVTVLPAYDGSAIFESLVEELVVSQIIFRSSHAGAEELVSIYGAFRRDPRFSKILQRVFITPPTKERFTELLGLRSETVLQKQKKKNQKTSCSSDMPTPNLPGKDQNHEQ